MLLYFDKVISDLEANCSFWLDWKDFHTDLDLNWSHMEY